MKSIFRFKGNFTISAKNKLVPTQSAEVTQKQNVAVQHKAASPDNLCFFNKNNNNNKNLLLQMNNEYSQSPMYS